MRTSSCDYGGVKSWKDAKLTSKLYRRSSNLRPHRRLAGHVRLAALDCAGDAAAEVAFEDAVEAAPDATRDAVLRDTVL
jgi:hypothetical protein